MKYEHGRRREKKGLRKKVLSSSRDIPDAPSPPSKPTHILTLFYAHEKKGFFHYRLCSHLLFGSVVLGVGDVGGFAAVIPGK